MSSCCWLLIGSQLLLCRRWLYNTVWIIDYHKLFLRFPRKKYQICPYSDAFKIRTITLFQKDEFLGLLWLQNRKKMEKKIIMICSYQITIYDFISNVFPADLWENERSLILQFLKNSAFSMDVITYTN